VKHYFPNARVQRLDIDAMRIKNKFQDIIEQFEKRQIDILVGTQLIVKGLDFEHVDLVGVLHADNLLSFPDFRVNERAFQLLEQVAGRAGRKHQQGKVMIQLYNTSHPLLPHVLQHNYHPFYLEEIETRKIFVYPPFVRILKIILKHKKEEKVNEAAQLLFDQIKNLPRSAFYGPSDPLISKVKNQYLKEILIKTQKDTTTLHQVKTQILEAARKLSTLPGLSQINVTIDVDPV
jgi:Primosomal protein N' (replication factor Y) - superfamily II helicase